MMKKIAKETAKKSLTILGLHRRMHFQPKRAILTAIWLARRM
jgi:hypothetical protein